MALQNMIQEILGIPGMNRGLAVTKINEAFQLIQDEQMWSFQVQTGGWLSPGILGGQVAAFLSPGTISVQPYTSQITGDAIATAAWYGASNPTITSYQIRIPYYSLYNIVSIGGNGHIAYATIFTAGSGQTPGVYTVAVLDNGGPGAGGSVSITVATNGTVTAAPTLISAGSGYTSPYIVFSEGGTPATFTVTQIAVLTLDRPWMEPPQVNSNYLSYQAYFAAPVGFKRWLNIRDTTNAQDMNWWEVNQDDLAVSDPQRTNFSQPEYVVAYAPDTRLGSATYGQELFELYEGPITSLPYTFMCQCDWPALTDPNSTVPFPLTEELVKFRTYEVISLWKEMQKGDEMERGSGANWQFLAKAYREEYNSRLKIIKVKDQNIREMYFQRMMRSPLNNDAFVSVSGQFNIGS